MRALDNAIDTSNALRSSVYQLRMSKQVDMEDALSSARGGSSYTSGSSGRDSQKYALFHGWLYSAVHALGIEAASQPVNIARLTSLGSEHEEEEKRQMNQVKSWIISRMTEATRNKMIHYDMEIIENHPVLTALENPNPIQSRWQFVYTFVCNLNLTGWAYIVADVGENGIPEYYSLPTTWVHPIHTKGPFSEFKIFNPKDPGAQHDAKTVGRESVAFAHLPNPSDPLSAMAPSSAQIRAIRIDDHIQTSQDGFFNRGIFPSVIISVGREPHPEVQGGVRPRLSATQRRQIQGAIRKTMAGVENYGEPAILDGLIENIERFSATSTEMGWKESELTVRSRILSAYAVHPFILGEPVNLGGYAQAAVIERRFHKRVNTFLDMLGNVLTNFVRLRQNEPNLLVWWDKCESVDPSIEAREWQTARQNGDVTRNEYRSRLGLPPSEEGERSSLLQSVGSISGLTNLMNSVGQGQIPQEVAAKMIELLFGVTPEEASELVNGFDVNPAEIVEVLSSMVETMKRPIKIDLPKITMDSIGGK